MTKVAPLTIPLRSSRARFSAASFFFFSFAAAAFFRAAVIDGGAGAGASSGSRRVERRLRANEQGDDGQTVV